MLFCLSERFCLPHWLRFSDALGRSLKKHLFRSIIARNTDVLLDSGAVFFCCFESRGLKGVFLFSHEALIWKINIQIDFHRWYVFVCNYDLNIIHDSHALV